MEGYLLTGRHGLFNCYEAFLHIIDAMFNQHAKWLDTAREIPWRRPVASLNYLLSSHVWRQDHNGFSHQDPGFLDVVVNVVDLMRLQPPSEHPHGMSDAEFDADRYHLVMDVIDRVPDLSVTSAHLRQRMTDSGIGRVAFGGAPGPTVFPVNYQLVGGVIVFRTREGGAMDQDLRSGIENLDIKIAFQVDRIDEADQGGWSVLIQGPAHHMSERELSTIAGADVRPWAGGDREHYIRVTPQRVTGRRITHL